MTDGLLKEFGHKMQEIFGMEQSRTSGSEMEKTNMNVTTGTHIELQPVWPQRYSASSDFTWFVKLTSTQKTYQILNWRNGSKVTFKNDMFQNRVNVTAENLTLFINSVQKQDSGLYYMTITNPKGHVDITTQFQVSVYDPVQEPELQVTWEPWNSTLCHVNLSCLVKGNSNLTYIWYRGREQINTSRQYSHIQLPIQAKNMNNSYTCEVSNPASSRSHTINLTWACPSPVYSSTPEMQLLMILGFSLIPLTMLLLSILICLYMKRKKQQQPVTDMNMTVYEKVNYGKPRSNQVQNFCGKEEGKTLYATVQLPKQLPASSPADQSKTLYSTVQFPKQKPSSKQMTVKSSNSTTVYQEVQRPNRLSRKELEIFHIYT
ncbi:natural killer cell receptor 2B4-like [Gracilinanus agilis]|uniref:natural killer cell receptor 2B4-like n=1 Tax=Gracilinanus agilis TaxID=191870 RepID=UPI001CFEF73C|nr:natural killer cell receptor 2B4-like [Gracilinanus agilis]